MINNTTRYNCYENKTIKTFFELSFNTFTHERSLKLNRAQTLMALISGQRTLLKNIRFYNKKKKILKKFFMLSKPNNRNTLNFLNYFVTFYSYFYNIFYTEKLKHAYLKNNLILFLDNYQFFFKNIRFYQRTRIKIIFSASANTKELYFKKYLSNFYLTAQ